MSTINKQSIYALHRYFIWANKMRDSFDKQMESKTKDTDNVEVLFTLPYMSYWYGGLYVVIEGWKELKLQDPIIDELLSNEKNISLLKRYRNGAFHFQNNYFDNRFVEFLSEKEIVPWIRRLNKEFGRYFLDFFNNN